MEIRWFDITRDIMRAELYPGDPAPELSLMSSIAHGDACNMAMLKMCLHTGTHVDAPLHFIERGTPLQRIPLSCFMGKCTVIQVPTGVITGLTVEMFFPQEAERILIKGNGSVHFDTSGAEALALCKGLRLVGTDALSIGLPEAEAGPHKAFMRENIAILENLDLAAVKPGDYNLMALPMRISGVEAAPVRAVLFDGIKSLF